MKEYYKINEISSLYSIGNDSLRYYEKLGILNPKRGENGYRLYSLRDISRLNVIKELRLLGFSMAQIKSYLDRLSVENTLALLQEESLLIEKKIADLRRVQKDIQGRTERIQEAEKDICNRVLLQQFPDRPCIQLNEKVSRDEEVDFLIKKLHKDHETEMQIIGSHSMGASLLLDDLQQGIYNIFHSVFFILEKDAHSWDFLLPAGDYLIYRYRGGYENSKSNMQKLLQYAGQKGYPVDGNPFELYKIDIHITKNPEEFLTEIQVKVITN